MLKIILSILITLSSTVAQASDIYLDPAKGETLQLFARGPVPADVTRVHLLPGYHGTPVFYGKTSPHDIEIIGTIGKTGTEQDTSIVDRTFLNVGAFNLSFRSITFRARVKMPVLRWPNALVHVNPGAHDIHIESSSFAITDDTSRWSDADYAIKDGNVQNLFTSDGANVELINNEFKNGFNLVTSNGDGFDLSRNRMHDFGNDGLEFSGSSVTIASNTIEHAHGGPWSPTALHSDAIQGMPNKKGVLVPNTNITIKNNVVDAGANFQGSMQGISAFDGRWRNVQIIGNKVRVRAYHAISWWGVDGIVIDQNEVQRYLDVGGRPIVTPNCPVPWIEVNRDKAGGRSTGLTIGQNITPRYAGDAIDALEFRPKPAKFLSAR